ncbi:MFS transporter [Nonomuraea sp. NPDC059194]|uniref:MFS transporter n=1 Tax=Nonomuraea sp. NPDC059194 TaxID=3346764 RepID=UPI0036C1EAD4
MDRDFRRLYVAAFGSQFGTQLSQVALPLLAVTALEASPGEVGLLSSLSTLVVLVMGLPAGVWVDRVRRRPVMVTMDAVRAAALASVTAAWWLDALTMEQLYLVAVVSGVGTLFFDVASHSMVPALVGRDRLTSANSLLVGTNSAMYISGRSVSGVLTQVFGAPLVLLLDAVTYVWSALWLRGIRAVEPPPAVREPVGRQLREGVQFLFGNRVLVSIAAQGAMVNLGFPLATVLLPVLLVRELALPEWVFGAFLAASGAGSLVGSAGAHLVARWLGQGRAVWLLGVLTAPFSLLVPLLDQGVWIWLSAAGFFVQSVRTGVNNVLLVSFRQQLTPDHMLGRMTSIMQVILMGAVGVGGLLAAGIGELWGVRATLWAGAILMAMSWAPLITVRSEIRQLGVPSRR